MAKKSKIPDVAKAPSQRGRPRAAKPRVLLTLRIDADLCKLIKGFGAGYSARVEAVLYKAAMEGAFGRAGGSRKLTR